MKPLTLEQCIDEFIVYQARLRKRPYTMVIIKKALLRQPVREAAALKREDILPLLERYHKALNERNLSNDLNKGEQQFIIENCISVSYKSYTRDKNTIKYLFLDFARYLEKKYGIELEFGFSNKRTPSTTFERQIAIIKMLHHNPKTTKEIAKKLEIRQEVVAEYLKKMNSGSLDEGLIINNRKVKLKWKKGTKTYEYIDTAHPLVLMPNLRQVIAMLEGLYAMCNSGHDSYAYLLSQNIWNQLSLYAKKCIKENIEPLNLTAEWYEQLESGEKRLPLYQPERTISRSNRQSGNWDLAYLIKCGRTFDFEYRENNVIIPYNGCKPIRLNEDNSGLYIRLSESMEEVLLLEQYIVNIFD